MKILKLPPYNSVEQVSSSHLGRDLTEAFVKAGFEIEIHCPTPSRNIDKATREKYRRLLYEEKYDKAVRIYRFRMFAEGRNSMMRACRYLLCNLIQYFKGAKVKDVDVIFGQSTPPTQGLLCGLVKRRLEQKTGKQIPFIYNLQDIFPDSLVNTGLTRKGSLLWKIGRTIEDFTYRHADKIIVISEDFKRNIMEKGVPEEKIVVVPNWVDTNEVRPISRAANPLFERYGIDRRKFIVSYCGNIGHTQNMDMLLDVAKQLSGEIPELLFVLVGEGAAKEHVTGRVAAEAIGNVRLLPFQPYSEISLVFSLGDIGLLISKPGVGGNSVPSKTWSYLAAGRPLLVSFDCDSSLTSLVGKVGCGLTCGAGDGDALAAALRRLHDQPGQAAEMGRRGLAYVMTDLQKDKCVMAYVQTIQQAIADGQNSSPQ